MNKISSAIEDIMNHNDFLAFGLQKNLLNLTQTAGYLKPFIEARTKKEVKEPAIVMCLSRLQKEMKNQAKLDDYDMPILSFTIKTGLVALTYFNNAHFREQLNSAYPSLRGAKTYFVQSQGVTEYEIIINETFYKEFLTKVTEPIKNIKGDLVSISVLLPEETYDKPGAFSEILQQIAFQGIVVYGASSTYTEFIFNIERKDLKLVIETLSIKNHVSSTENLANI